MMHCITEHACDNTTRVLTLPEQYVLEQVRSRGFGLSDVVRATTPLTRGQLCNYVA